MCGCGLGGVEIEREIESEKGGGYGGAVPMSIPWSFAVVCSVAHVSPRAYHLLARSLASLVSVSWVNVRLRPQISCAKFL